MTKIEICKVTELKDRQPRHVLIDNIDLVVIATQKENLRSRIKIETSAKQLCNF